MRKAIFAWRRLKPLEISLCHGLSNTTELPLLSEHCEETQVSFLFAARKLCC